MPYTHQEHAELRALNTLRVAARARHLVELEESAALATVLGEVYARLRGDGLAMMVLGEGSNLLLVGDYPGLMLRLSLRQIEIAARDAHAARVRAGAGVVWDEFVSWTLARGLAGLENLALIPGLVGAAPIQNIGAYGVEVGEFIATVEAWDRDAGQCVRLDARDCGFGYRDSRFKREAERWLVTAVEFALPRRFEPRTAYAGIDEELRAMGGPTVTAATVAEAVRRLRRRKLPDPRLIPNAGSFFKNPVIERAQSESLRALHPTLPVYPTDDPAHDKLSAAWLIESCGWRGHREGDAGIAAQHALVLVNHGAASGAQLLALARRVAASVHERYGLTLEPEPRIVGARFDETG